MFSAAIGYSPGYYIIVNKTDNNQDTNLIEHNNIIINIETAAVSNNKCLSNKFNF